MIEIQSPSEIPTTTTPSPQVSRTTLGIKSVLSNNSSYTAQSYDIPHPAPALATKPNPEPPRRVTSSRKLPSRSYPLPQPQNSQKRTHPKRTLWKHLQWRPPTPPRTTMYVAPTPHHPIGGCLVAKSERVRSRFSHVSNQAPTRTARTPSGTV